jgi:hypothetical protein
MILPCEAATAAVAGKSSQLLGYRPFWPVRTMSVREKRRADLGLRMLDVGCRT